MRRIRFVCGPLVVVLAGLATTLDGEEPKRRLADLVPVMVDITDRELPSPEEWHILHDDVRGNLLGSIADFHSNTISFLGTRYHTANAAEGTLASFGKLDPERRYDRFGLIQGVEFAAEQNSWKQRQVVNAAALLKLAGSRFFEYAGVDFKAAVENRTQIEVTFLGTMVPKDEAVRRINADIQALEYFEALQQKIENFKKPTGLKLFSAPAPPKPKVVLGNVVMLNANFSQALDASADGKLHSRVAGAGVELKVVKQDGETTTFLSPVVRCYRTYSVEFKTGPGGDRSRVTLTDSEGNKHSVPQVFDLTPDL